MGILQLVLVSVLVCAPIQAGAPDPDTGVVVGGHQWGMITGKTVLTDRGSFNVGPNTRLPKARPGSAPYKIIVQREAYVLVKNLGTREVKAVDWVYVFYSDAKREHEVGRFKFRSKETVKPGETKFLNQSVHDQAPTAYDAVFIVNVEFGDAKR